MLMMNYYLMLFVIAVVESVNNTCLRGLCAASRIDRSFALTRRLWWQGEEAAAVAAAAAIASWSSSSSEPPRPEC